MITREAAGCQRRAWQGSPCLSEQSPTHWRQTLRQLLEAVG